MEKKSDVGKNADGVSVYVKKRDETLMEGCFCQKLKSEGSKFLSLKLKEQTTKGCKTYGLKCQIPFIFHPHTHCTYCCFHILLIFTGARN